MSAFQKDQQKKLFTSIAVLVVITFLVFGAKALNHTNASPSPAPTTTASQQTTSSNTGSQTGSGTYKDGTYMAPGKYNSPGGIQTIIVSLTVKDNTVSDSTVNPQAKDGVAQIYQSDFTNGYKQFVVGKKLNDIKISRVSGSSLTSQGFNSALKQIEGQAKS
jgi:uncharacterized protein with FMN-binding domain